MIANKRIVNITPEQASAQLWRVVDELADLQPPSTTSPKRRGRLPEAQRRVRSAARQTGVRYSVPPQLPPDVLGMYLLPVVV